MSQTGQLIQTSFTDNTGGINLVDSVFKIKDTQAADGYNFDYILTGGIRKRLGPLLINSAADAQTRAFGFGLYSTASGGIKSVMRAAGSQLQLFDTSTPSFTALSGDTVSASTSPYSASSTETVNFVQFNNGTANLLWSAGAGTTLPIGAYSTTKYTTNGVAAPTGSFSATRAASGGTWTATGAFFYAIAYRKRSTQALSNVALDVTATVTAATDKVTLDFTGLTGLDTTLIDKIYIYRSAVSGVSAFTTGSLVTTIDSTTTTFVDLGQTGNPDSLSSQNVPRAGNVILDNSVLPAGTYTPITLFKQRLVVAQNSTIYLSDLNKSESWPTTNTITVPSAGPITALAVVSFTSPQAQTLNELLVVFKEREMWVVTGTAYTDWALLSIDNSTGCPQQSLVVNVQGWLAWIDFRGIHLWDGTGKPYYCSRPIEPLFAYGGSLDLAKLNLGVGEFFRRENQIIWYLSSRIFGEQQFAIKMDIRLTLLEIDQTLTGRNIDATFIQDSYAFPVYAAMSFIPLNGSQEQMVLGDSSGYCYYASNNYADNATGIDFKYKTPALSMGDPNIRKQFHKVIAWVQNVGTWNLMLDYWTDYQTDVQRQSTRGLAIGSNTQSTGVYDIARFDVSTFDSYYPNIVPVIFNLGADELNNSQGSAIQLQFRNSNVDQPVTIHGYSVIWSELGGITA